MVGGRESLPVSRPTLPLAPPPDRSSATSSECAPQTCVGGAERHRRSGCTGVHYGLL